MFSQIPTKTEIAKNTLSGLVGMSASRFAKAQLEQRTEMNPDGIPVAAITGAAGAAVSLAAMPVTDRTVDFVIAKFQSWREKKNAKKNTE